MAVYLNSLVKLPRLNILEKDQEAALIKLLEIVDSIFVISLKRFTFKVT